MLQSTDHNQIRQQPFSSPASDSHIKETQISQFSETLDLKFFRKCKNLAQVHQVHGQVIVNGLIRDLSFANKILYGYTLHRALESASSLFCGISEKNAVSWSVMIGGYAKADDYVNCYSTFREYMRSGDRLDNYTLPVVIRVCRNTRDLQMGRFLHCVVHKYGFGSHLFVAAVLVDMYAKWACTECGNPEEALDLFDRMREEGVIPDKVAMVNVVNASAKLGVLHKAKIVDNYIQKMRFSLDVVLGTALVDMHAKCGSIELAREVFDRMGEKNVISWSTMIAAHGYHGEGQKALDLFHIMLRNGILPNNITFISLLYACSHSGLVEGLRLFSIMQEEYEVRPDVKHFTCVVDLFGRAGKLDQAVTLIENMDIDKDAGLWGALLGACRIHGHVELARKVAESLLELQPQNAGHYVLLSNIYAKAGRWKQVAKVRELMTHQRIKKIPGWTWTEVDNKIHKFSVGDHTHPLSKEIYEELKCLSEKLELAGYVPDTNFVLHDIDEELKLGLLHAHSEKLAIAFGLISTPEGWSLFAMQIDFTISRKEHALAEITECKASKVYSMTPPLNGLCSSKHLKHCIKSRKAND
ncbi:UNVERIFIED_CONTAM: Pentatricopeptide repeat-containing protein, chloroplastic [Sesamum calycinum]|uniref:Pentatricopeptide repeat-containing protein, chloroplastic n=1 Tax=Sesamum calycinum TaxID=2727403 RepID=A0AAW2N0F5_9LAMI